MSSLDFTILRTPEERFTNLPDFPYLPHYTDVGGLRMAHVEAGPADAHPVLMLHGEPSWSFLYRKMMPRVASAGHRVLAPDLVGCGRSDKPATEADYTYARHVEWMTRWMQANDLHHTSPLLATATQLRMAASEPFKSTCPARRASRTSPSWARVTFCRRIKARN